MHQSAIGRLVLIATITSFVYLTLWLLVKPFIDTDQPVLALFPPTSYLYLPLGTLIATGIASILTYVGVLIILEQPRALAVKQD